MNEFIMKLVKGQPGYTGSVKSNILGGPKLGYWLFAGTWYLEERGGQTERQTDSQTYTQMDMANYILNMQRGRLS